MSNSVLISVLICTYNRADLLRGTLGSLCCQTMKGSDFEVVVVDDGSADTTRATASAFESRLNLRYAYQHNSGLAAARNHALFLSQGRLALFLDDDDVAVPRLLEEHARTHRKYPNDNFAVLGYTNLDPELQSDPVMHFVVEVGQFLFSYPGLRDGQILGYAHFWGGRTSCKRRFLLEHGVFNPVFRFGCEDIELAYRLRQHGLQVAYNSRAITSMVRSYSFDQFCERLVRQGRSNFVFSQLHPDPEVQAWTGAEDLEKWNLLGPVYESFRKSGAELDRIFRFKQQNGLGAPEDKALLHEAYWVAFRASKIKGMAEAAIEAGKFSRGEPEPSIPVSGEAAAPPLMQFLAGCPPLHGSVTWGLSEDTLAYLDQHVEQGWHTLETGSGLSTLLFARAGAHHTCITTSEDEIARIKQHCRDRGVDTGRLSFAVGPSHQVLPVLSGNESLDLVLIDGCHGFPIPFLDWLYCAPRIRLGGIVIVDDTQLWTGEVLRDVMEADPDWQLDRRFVRGAAFRKVGEFRLKEWNEQAYVAAHSKLI